MSRETGLPRPAEAHQLALIGLESALRMVMTCKTRQQAIRELTIWVIEEGGSVPTKKRGRVSEAYRSIRKFAQR